MTSSACVTEKHRGRWFTSKLSDLRIGVHARKCVFWRVSRAVYELCNMRLSGLDTLPGTVVGPISVPVHRSKGSESR